jgi:hypothetical protein
MRRHDEPPQSFEELARTTKSSFVRDLLGLMAVTKKWWLLPIILMLLALSVLLLASGTVVAPFIYTLF